MTYVVLFMKDGTTELLEQKTGISFQMKELKKEKVNRIYVANSLADAKVAIEAFGESYCL